MNPGSKVSEGATLNIKVVKNEPEEQDETDDNTETPETQTAPESTENQ